MKKTIRKQDDERIRKEQEAIQRQELLQHDYDYKEYEKLKDKLAKKTTN